MIPVPVSVQVAEIGLILGLTRFTVTVAVPFTDPEVAVMVAVPFAIAVTSPAEDTVATPVADETQLTVGLEMTFSLASLTVGVRVAVSPVDVNDKVSGDKVSEPSTCSTVTVAVPFTDPEVAVIVAVPFAIAVTRPATDTVAILVSDEVQVTLGLEIVFPLESLTVGVTVAVSPSVLNESESGVKMIVSGV
jgi:hypothetical protein